MANEEEYSFIEEEIMESKKTKRQMVATIKKATVSGIMFGVMAGLCFSIVSYTLGKTVGDSSEEKIALATSGEPATTNASQTEIPKVKVPTDKKEPVFYDSISDFHEEFASIAKKSKRSLVGISLYNPEKEELDAYNMSCVSSGIIVAKTRKNLMILTKYSALSTEEVRVSFCDGTTITGGIYRWDTDLDLAVIRIPLNKLLENTREKLKVVKMDVNAQAVVGDIVYALGSPNGKLFSAEYGYLTLDEEKKSIEDYMVDRYTTSMKYHNKGFGMICNRNGDMIGLIDTSKDDTENCTFYGIDRLQFIIENMLNGVEQCYSGIVAAEIPSEMLLNHNLRTGIYVTAVQMDSPAYEAGVLVGDVITDLDGEPVNSIDGYFRALQEHKVGDKVEVTVLRDAFGDQEKKKMKLKLAKRK